MTLATNWVDNIGMYVNAAYLNQVGAEVNADTNSITRTGTYSARPAANSVTAGTLYYSQENNVIYRSDGTNWSRIRIAGNSCDAMGDVPQSGWTAVNMQTSTFTADKDDMLFTVPNAGSAVNWRYQYRTYPTPPFTLTVYLDVFITATSTDPGAEFGIIVSDGTKLITVGPNYNRNSGINGLGVWAKSYTNLTTDGTIYSNGPVANYGAIPKWFRFNDDGTNMNMTCSPNGADWVSLASIGRTSFLTPTRIAIGASNDASSSNAFMRVRSWAIT